MKKVTHFSLLFILFYGLLNINSYAQLPYEDVKERATQQTYIEELYEESEKAIDARE